MICATCDGTGLWPYVDVENERRDAEVGVGDLHFALCLCEAGLRLRGTENHDRRVAPLWMAWCAREHVPFDRVCLLEDVWTSDQLTEAGFRKPVARISREAALLAAGKGKPR